MNKKIFSLLLVSFFVFPEPGFSETLEEKAANAIPHRVLQSWAQDALSKLVRAYETRDLDGFMKLVSDNFLSSDGKRRLDLQKSLITDFEELYHARIRMTSINQRVVPPGFPRKVSIVGDWNRNTDVEISTRRRRWLFQGRTEFTFKLETDADLKQMAEESGAEIDFNKVPWEMRLVSLRGDGLFGLTSIKGLLEVVPGTVGRRSTLDGQIVRTPIAVGETGQMTSFLRNRTATLPAAGPGPSSIDFRTGAIFSGAAPGISSNQGDVEFALVAGSFTTIGSARISRVFTISANDFNNYNLDVDPRDQLTAAVIGGVYVVRTQAGNFAKFVVLDFPGGAAAAVLIKFAFQPNRTGTLVSRD